MTDGRDTAEGTDDMETISSKPLLGQVLRLARPEQEEANETAKVRQFLAKSIRHMKDITGPKWEKFAKDNPGLAAASVNMAAQDAIRAMEEADKLLAMTKEAAPWQSTKIANDVDKQGRGAEFDSTDLGGSNT